MVRTKFAKYTTAPGYTYLVNVEIPGQSYNSLSSRILCHNLLSYQEHLRPLGNGSICYLSVFQRTFKVLLAIGFACWWLLCFFSGEDRRTGTAVKTWKRRTWRGAVQKKHGLALVRDGFRARYLPWEVNCEGDGDCL